MLYLKASTSIETMDEYNGEKGMWIKTFAVNDQRNKNGWRLSWDSIKKRIGEFIGFPGIEYMRCENNQCDLDHIDASTYEASLKIQAPFQATEIKDYTLNEDTHTAFFIHKTDNAEFYAKVKSGEISFVSPAVWPKTGAYTVLPGRMPNGEPILDVYDWKPLHDAFLTKDPAYGDVATVTATCEGHDCEMRLLTAKEIAASENLRKEFDDIPALIKHKDHLVYVSLKGSVSKQVDDLFEENSRPGTNALMAILKNNSFSSCSCSSKMLMSPEETLKAELETTKTALTASEKSKKDSEDKVKELESKIAKLEASAKTACAKCGSTDHMTQNHTKENSANKNDDDNDDAETAKKAITALEKKLAKPMIDEMLKAREVNGATQEELTTIRTSLTAKSLAEIESQFNSEQVFITSVKARATEPGVHLPFNGETEGALTGKTLEEIFGDSS